MCGGLGNQLFQIAAGKNIAENTGRKLVLPIQGAPATHHSRANYFNTIFSGYACYQNDYFPDGIVRERSFHYIDWDTLIDDKERPLLSGYFHHWMYVPETFMNTLVLPPADDTDVAFLHIRGGDYKKHWLHDVGLDSYYRRAIQMFPRGTTFYVFTNDIEYAKTQSFLDTIDYEFVDEQDEVAALSKMTHCTRGGICANSTFSWWGAYLNRNGRTLVLPSKWFTNSSMHVEGYFFPGAIICQV